MAKLFTEIGYAPSFQETVPGVWEEQAIVKNYYAEVFRNSRRLESSGQVNDNVNVNNRISIVSDPYARENFHAIRWVKFMGSKWKVSDVEVQYPRLILTLGGLYNDRDDLTTENGASDDS